MQLTASWFLVLVSLVAAVGFMVYGGRLVAMLCRFPLESRGRTKKMHEVRCIFYSIALSYVCTCTSNLAGQLVSRATSVSSILRILWELCSFQLPAKRTDYPLHARRHTHGAASVPADSDV